MLNSNVLDVAIGMAFVYLLLSLLCSAVAEFIAGTLGLRAKNLEAGIRSLFSDGVGPRGNAFVREIYEHGLVRGLYRDGADLVPTKNVPVTTHYQKPKGDAGRKTAVLHPGADVCPGGARHSGLGQPTPGHRHGIDRKDRGFPTLQQRKGRTAEPAADLKQ